MIHALMGKFQLELFIFITYFSTVVPLISCVFFPAGFSLLTRQTTRPVENVALTTKGLLERKQLVRKTTVEKIGNKNK